MKRATVVISLVEDCSDLHNCDIEQEIKNELSENLSVIPWATKIEHVSVE